MRRPARSFALVLVSVLLAWPRALPAQVCGDGVVADGETCDPPGSPAGSWVCRADCTFCGDMVVNGEEACDTGALGTCAPCGNACTYQIIDFLGDGGCPCGLDDPDLVRLRADILAACACSSVSSRGAFVRCARTELDRAALGARIFPGCRRTALKCLARSVCGKPGAVTCCRTTARGGKTCLVKRDAAHCTAPKGGSAVLGIAEDCCDACP